MPDAIHRSTAPANVRRYREPNLLTQQRTDS
jgi:hypothetical protein